MGKAMHLSRAMVAVVVVVAVTGWGRGTARANQSTALDQIIQLSQQAMVQFDSLNYSEAIDLLDKALVVAANNDLDSEPAVARVHLNMGIIYYSSDDRDKARLAFIRTVKIDSSIEILPEYITPEMGDLLDELKEKYRDRNRGRPRPDGCASLSGIDHTLIESTPAGVDLAVAARVGGKVRKRRASVHFRLFGVAGAEAEYTEIAMKRTQGCLYAAVIPGAAIKKGGNLHYYVAVYNKEDRIVANSGEERSPHIVYVTGGSDGDEIPKTLAGRGKTPETEPIEVNRARLTIAVKLGTGGAYVTGDTEQLDAPVNCCFAPALLHISAEAGYYLEPRINLGASLRLGFPIGANLDEHATLAPAGLAHLRFTPAHSGHGLILSAVLGGGVIRQTVKLEDVADPSMDTDTTAIGPVLVGGGVGYSRPVGGPMRFVAGADITFGIPVVDKLGTSKPSFGIQFDLSLGIVVAL